jgi:hypothetical protein
MKRNETKRKNGSEQDDLFSWIISIICTNDIHILQFLPMPFCIMNCTQTKIKSIVFHQNYIRI